MSTIANLLLDVAYALSNSRGSKPEYRIKDHSIEVEFTKPEDTEERVWENHYKNGNLYIGDSAQPVKVETEKDGDGDIKAKVVEGGNGEVSLTTTDYYKTVLRQNVISDALSTGGTGLSIEAKLMIANLVFTGFLAMIVVGVTMA